MEYMKTGVLKIDFIDDSVEAMEGQRDYIGSARIPLRQLMMDDHIADNYAVVDEVGKEHGRVEVKIGC